MWIVVRIMCGDVATPIIFSYMDTHPMGGGGCLGDGLPYGKYMLWFAESIWY